MTAAIYRYEVPVDDQWHQLELCGDILHVAARTPYRVELWTLHGAGPTSTRTFRVVATGQPLPDEYTTYRGTAIVPGGQLIWHLLERQ
ncbi:DUF7352 domain-containing protein [Streptomyces malaysiensis]